MLARVLVLLVLALLSGCVVIPESRSDIRMGDAVEAPYGYTELCQREPTAPECGGK